jgi:hypothetical protein
MVSEALGYSPLNQLKQLVDREYFVEFSRRESFKLYTRWFKYDRDYLCVNKSQFVPVIFEPPCTRHTLTHLDNNTELMHFITIYHACTKKEKNTLALLMIFSTKLLHSRSPAKLLTQKRKHL